VIAPLIALALLAEGAPAAPAAAPGLPKPLAEMAASKKKDGTPALTEEQLKFLGTLPERIQKQLSDAIDGQLLGSAQQLSNLLSLQLSPQLYEVIASDNCVLCHTDPSNVKAKSLFSPDPAKSGSNPKLDLRELTSDVHFRKGLSCSGCHGGKPTDDTMSDEISKRWPAEGSRHSDRSWIPEFCSRCHSDAGFMRGFNPTLPTDQLAKYKESKHGQVLLEKKDSRAAQCISCHGVHGIRNSKSRKSMVHAQRIPETCGACHADPKHMAGFTKEDGTPLPTNQLAEYKTSVHGKALLEKGDLGAPACNACHGNHAAMPPKVESVSQVCRRCHTQNGSLFDGSRHKAVFEEHRWPECGQCHNHHAIMKPSEAALENHPGALCFDCHAKNSQNNPTCQKTATHFNEVITGLKQGRTDLAPEVEHLAEQGLDVEPMARSLGELDEALVTTRTSIHRFEAAYFDDAARPAQEALKKASVQAGDAHGEHRFRMRGLLGAMGVMALLALGLALKLRELDRRRAEEDEKK
jgi:predicted CXXCH cytochrome family protein